MTQREMTSDVLDEIAAAQTINCHLYQAYFDSGTLYLTDAGMDILWNGQTYTNSGQVVGFDAIEETAGLEISGVNVTCSGVDSAVLSLFTDEDFIDRRLVIYRAFFDTAGVIINDPVLLFDGRMDGPAFEEDYDSQIATITVPAASLFVDFELSNGRKTNPTDQQRFFANDRFFNNTLKLAEKIIRWGT